MSDFWNWLAPFYDPLISLLFGRPYRRMLEWIRLRVDHGMEVLELGAGTGAIAREVAPRCARYLATDLAPAMVARLSTIPYVTARGHDASQSWPDPHERFDIVIMGNLIHLLDRPGPALAAILPSLRPGGVLLLPTFCHGEDRWSRLVSSLAYHLGLPVRHRFSAKGLSALVEQAGFEKVQHQLVKGLIPLALVEARKPLATIAPQDKAIAAG
ncbi:MAG: class I SAM-dependent methyltransferase [Vulcanimicrobiota bacterium]